jgi:hypothetical protein
MGGLVMPLRRLLEGGNFGPEAIAILLESFDEAVADLDLRSDLDRNKAARIISLACAQTGDH